MPAAKDAPKSSEIPRATPQGGVFETPRSTNDELSGPAWHNEEPRRHLIVKCNSRRSYLPLSSIAWYSYELSSIEDLL